MNWIISLGRVMHDKSYHVLYMILWKYPLLVEVKKLISIYALWISNHFTSAYKIENIYCFKSARFKTLSINAYIVIKLIILIILRQDREKFRKRRLHILLYLNLDTRIRSSYFKYKFPMILISCLTIYRIFLYFVIY